jgi:uncharacterized integral membrane protein
MVYVKWIILIIVLLFFITFGVKNSQSVYLNYYFDLQYIELPLYGLVYIAILLGIFIGMIVGILDRLNLRKTVKRLGKEKKELHENLAAKERELARIKESERQEASRKEKEPEKEKALEQETKPPKEETLEEDEASGMEGELEKQEAPTPQEEEETK